MMELLPLASTHRAYPVVVVAIAVLAAAGCGRSGPSFRVSPAAAARDVASARKEWLGEVRANAIADSARRFANLSRRVFTRRLRAAARRYGFAVESVTWRDAGAQDVPDVVVESSRYAALARDLPHVLDTVDPPPRSNSRAYEAIFIEAVDARHVPFVAIFDSLRDHVMGGQWARADALFPYPHG